MFQPQKSSAPRGIRHKAGYLHVAARPPGDLRARIRQLQDSFRELHDRGSFSAPDVNRTRNVLTARSEEHTSELQSRGHLVCRLLLEKKKNHILTLFRREVSSDD